jgi:hypothetical protein
MQREVIYSALFTLLQGVGGVALASRRLRLWSEVAACDRPALFLSERAEQYVRANEAMPATVTLEADIYLYVNADDLHIPATALNALLDAVDMALAPAPLSGRQTLGGLVSHCWIEGKIIKDTGDLDGDGVAILPVRMLVAG